ncbi:MAG: hypothetical protein IJY31_02380 [Muribaculaceae bacterium]|nr:hypothetical protein [Muribaculaceae bacterium]
MNGGKHIFAVLAAIVVMTVFGSCIEDDITTSASDQPVFSVDTLKMGMVFTQEGTPTRSFRVYNRHDKILNISSISIREGNGIFRLNVDGMSGKTFHNVEIRPNDSIYVFVEATLPTNGNGSLTTVNEHLDFLTNGVTRTVVLNADGQDVDRKHGEVIETDTRWTADMPYQIYDSLVVKEGATLTLDAGTHLYFHDKAYMMVRGTLIAEGTPESPINFTGDRTGNVVNGIPYELMSGQWGGLTFSPTSRDNRLCHTSIRNTTYGVQVDSTSVSDRPTLYMLNCQLRNSTGHSLIAIHSNVTAIGCEIAEAASGTVYLRGGNHVFNHCTLANYYLFSALGGPIIGLDHINSDTDDNTGRPYMTADFTNTIVYGNGTDISHGDLTGTSVTLRNCLLKSNGTNDDNFINCLWGKDPLYHTVREQYLFDYRLKYGSPAIGAANPELTLPEAATDMQGKERGSTPDMGAYVYSGQ